MMGPTTTMIQAPSVNLAMMKITTTSDVTNAEVALIATPRRQWGSLTRRCRAPCRPGHGESREDADGVERDEGIDRCVKGDDQDERDDAEHQDAVGERQAVTALGELTRRYLSPAT